MFALVIVAGLVTGTCEAAESLMDRLAAHNAFLEQPLHVEATATMPANPADAEQGVESWSLSATSTGSTVAMSVNVAYDREPVYRAPGSSGYVDADHAPDGALRQWRRELVETELDLAAGTALVTTTQRLWRVRPDAETEVASDATVRTRDHSISTEGVWLPLWLALGRGYDIERFTSGIRKGMTAEGMFGNIAGTWVLTLDQGNLLVRKASFARAGSDTPVVSIETSGTNTTFMPTGERVLLASEGTVVHHLAGGDYAMSFKLDSLGGEPSATPE